MARILLYRLEKISADSPYAHRASGIKAAIAKLLSRESHPGDGTETDTLQELLAKGFEILEKAAGEIPDPGGTRTDQENQFTGNHQALL